MKKEKVSLKHKNRFKELVNKFQDDIRDLSKEAGFIPEFNMFLYAKRKKEKNYYYYDIYVEWIKFVSEEKK